MKACQTVAGLLGMGLTGFLAASEAVLVVQATQTTWLRCMRLPWWPPAPRMGLRLWRCVRCCP